MPSDRPRLVRPELPGQLNLAKLGVLAAIAAVVVSLYSAFTVVAPGNSGVVFNMWTGGLRTVGQGMVWRIPFATRVQIYPTSLRTYTMVARANEGSAAGDDSIDLPTREGQHIRQDISVTYNTPEERAADVFKSFRGADISEIEGTYIRRTVITIAQNGAGEMSLAEIISSRRGDLQNLIQKNLGMELDKMGFHLDKVNLGASHLPAAIESQMQEKMKVQQEAQQAEYELQKQQTLAKAAVAKAEGEGQSILVRAKAEAEANRMLQSTLSASVMQNKAIEKWNGAVPQVSGGGTPFIDLRPAKETAGK